MTRETEPTVGAREDAEAALLRRAEDACRPCGPCDGGLPMGCNCDPEPRAVIAGLLALLERVRAAERERLAGVDYGHVVDGDWYATGEGPTDE